MIALVFMTQRSVSLDSCFLMKNDRNTDMGMLKQGERGRVDGRGEVGRCSRQSRRQALGCRSDESRWMTTAPPSNQSLAGSWFQLHHLTCTSPSNLCHGEQAIRRRDYVEYSSSFVCVTKSIDPLYDTLRHRPWSTLDKSFPTILLGIFLNTASITFILECYALHAN
jgi:hypothetical protein